MLATLAKDDLKLPPASAELCAAELAFTEANAALRRTESAALRVRLIVIGGPPSKPEQVAAAEKALEEAQAVFDAANEKRNRLRREYEIDAQNMRSGATRIEAGQAARAANRAAAGQGASATVRIGATARHSIFAEFGTVKMSAQPFMGPALRSKGKASVESIKDDLRKEIMATAKRVAARRSRKKG